MPELDDKTRLLLNAIQNEVPLVDRPYKALGEKIGCSEDEVIEKVRTLKEQKILRNVSAIFDTRSLGYHSSLVACKAAEKRIDEVAAVFSRHPGVSHNYARRHEFNIWFTIAVPGDSSLQQHLDALQKESGASSLRPLPTLRLFKIGMKLDMTDGKARKMGLDDEGPLYSDKQREGTLPPLTERDKQFIVALQEDLGASPEPFAEVAKHVNTVTSELLGWCRASIENGRLRRMAGIMNHHNAGFRANGMCAWEVPPERIEETGSFFAQQPSITHCYLRPTYPDWPYNIFTMIHSKQLSTCDAFIAEMSQKTGIKNFAALYSYKEYKKVRLKYFTGEIEEWERAHGLTQALSVQ
jgi:DNA-binding Lrp family transcriptional regulator